MTAVRVLRMLALLCAQSLAATAVTTERRKVKRRAPAPRRRRKAEFRHVPKTAGSSIEDGLRDHGVYVGRRSRNRKEWDRACAYHNPARLSNSSVTFCVARDPVARFVSEHNWQCSSTRHMSMWKGRRECTPAALNAHVDEVHGGKLHASTRGHCHYVPQHLYDCDVRLPFADVANGIRKFAAAHYGIENFALPARAREKGACALAVRDLTPSSVAKLRGIYAGDLRYASGRGSRRGGVE